MIKIKTNTISKLRTITHSGIMECKKALIKTKGDIKKARELLCHTQNIKKRVDNKGKEGIIKITSIKNLGIIIEINCETDFTSKNKSFIKFTTNMIQTIIQYNPHTVNILLKKNTYQKNKIEEQKEQIIKKIKEIILIKKILYYIAKGRIFHYTHNKKIGIIIDFIGNNNIGQDIVLHIIAKEPLYISKKQAKKHIIKKQKNNYRKKVIKTKKSLALIKKIINKYLKHFLLEITLFEQNFIKNTNITIKQLIHKKKSYIKDFKKIKLNQNNNII